LRVRTDLLPSASEHPLDIVALDAIQNPWSYFAQPLG
jgi:hypothetical protein